MSAGASGQHLLACVGARPCPARGCDAIVSRKVAEEGRRDPRLLASDHGCREIYDCRVCGTAFLRDHELSDHACSGDPDAEAPLPRRRRAAFLRAAEAMEEEKEEEEDWSFESEG